MRQTYVALLLSFTGPVALAPACGEDRAGDVSVPDQSDQLDASETTVPETTATTTAPPDVAEDVDTGPIVCGDFHVSGQLVANDAPGAFTLGGGVDLGFGGPLPDAVVLEFYTNETGSFDLTTGGNKNYATCEQCVRIVQDIDPEDKAATRHFFQTGGTMIVSEATPPDSGFLDVELVDLQLAEVTIFADFHTELVNRGACYTHTGSVQLETAPCTPTCGDHVCGPDGCGGQCGEGCTSGVCLLDGSGCDAEPECYVLHLPGGQVLDNTDAGVYRLETTTLGLGAVSESDFLQLEFYTRATGIIDLATTENADYSTCKQCVRVVIDGGKREMFQAGGAINLQAGSDVLGDPEGTPPGGNLSANLQNVRLVEVTYEKDTFHTHIVPGGACIDVVLDAPLAKEP